MFVTNYILKIEKPSVTAKDKELVLLNLHFLPTPCIVASSSGDYTLHRLTFGCCVERSCLHQQVYGTLLVLH